jgi:chromosome condensin MukBEF MukE localization factor|tara:strand:- start:5900 stop:6166 length:267 start_codon:yes stop_codon:yes gene_type:complete
MKTLSENSNPSIKDDAQANIWLNETEIQVMLTALRCYLTLAPEFDRVEKTARIQSVYNDLMEIQRKLTEYKKQRLKELEEERNGPSAC